MAATDHVFKMPYYFDTNVEDKRAINNREIERTLNGVITGEIPVGGSSTSAWANWSPTFESSVFSITTSSVDAARYTQISGTVFFTASFTITTNGLGGGALLFSLPVTAANTSLQIGSGREYGLTAPTGDQLLVWLWGTTTGAFTYYNGNYPGVDNAQFHISGFYEAA